MKFFAVFFLILLNAICSAQDNVIRYSENGKYGFKDNLDNVIIKAGSYYFLNPIDEEGMILAKKNGKEGYINLKEDILIPFIYDNLSVFSENGLAPATINKKSGFINRKGETVILFVYDGTGWFYDLGLSSVYIGDKGGFVNKEGKIVIPVIYDKIKYNKVDHIVQVQKNKKWAFFDNNGQQLSDFVFDEIEESQLKDRFYTVFENGLGLVKKNGKCGYINKGMKTIVPFGKYNECKPFENNQIAIVKNNKKYKLINKHGEELSVAYDEIYKDDNFYLTKIKNKFGVLDSLGNQVFPNQDKEINIVSFNFKNKIKNFFLIKSIQDKYGIVNEKREDVIPIKYDSLSVVTTDNISGKIIVAREKNRFGILNIENQIILPFDYTKIEYFGDKQDYFYAYKGDFMSLMDKDLKLLFPFVYSEIQPDVFNEQNRFIVQQNGKFGIIDRSNNIILPIEYDYISNWVEYGPKNIHNIQKNQKYGLIDTDGKIIMPITYDNVLILNDKCVFVSNNGKYGVMDAYNNKILDVIYDEIYYYENHSLDTYYQLPDSFYVKINGKYDLIDKKGNILKSNANRTEIDSYWMKISN